MATSALATAFVNIVPGTQQMEAYLKGELPASAGGAGVNAGGTMAQGMGTGLGSKLKGYLAPIFAGMAASFAAVGIKNFLGDATTYASDFAEQGAAVGQVFGDAAGEIQKFASVGAKALGQSKVQVLEAAKQFGIYGKAAGLAGQENAKFSGDLVKLATDLASFNNTSVDDAILALGAGLRGESEPLRRYGVLITETSLKNKAMEMGLGTMTKTARGYTFTMTEQEKVLARNGLIFEQTATQQGDFARTSGGLANQQRILTAQMDNLKISIGNGLLPAMTGLATIANNYLVPALTVVFGFFRDYAAPIGAFVGTIGLLTLALNAQAIATAITTSATWAWTAALLANPLTWIVLGIAAVVAALTWFFTQTELGQQIWQTMVDAISGAIIWLWEMVLKPIFDFIGVAFKFLWDFWLNPVINAWIVAFALIATAVDFLWTNAIGPALSAIGKFFGYVWTTFIKPFVDVVVNAFTSIGNVTKSIFGAIGKWIGDAFNGIVGVVRGPVNFIIDLLNSMIDGLNKIKIDVPDWVPVLGGQKLGFNIPKIPKLADGGFVTQPTTALIGEAGPEVVTPLKDFERMMNIDNAGNGKTINYYAAPNTSLDSEQQLFTAIKRAKVIAGW